MNIEDVICIYIYCIGTVEQSFTASSLKPNKKITAFWLELFKMAARVEAYVKVRREGTVPLLPQPLPYLLPPHPLVLLWSSSLLHLTGGCSRETAAGCQEPGHGQSTFTKQGVKLKIAPRRRFGQGSQMTERYPPVVVWAA